MNFYLKQVSTKSKNKMKENFKRKIYLSTFEYLCRDYIPCFPK